MFFENFCCCFCCWWWLNHTLEYYFCSGVTGISSGVFHLTISGAESSVSQDTIHLGFYLSFQLQSSSTDTWNPGWQSSNSDLEPKTWRQYEGRQGECNQFRWQDISEREGCLPLYCWLYWGKDRMKDRWAAWDEQKDMDIIWQGSTRWRACIWRHSRRTESSLLYHNHIFCKGNVILKVPEYSYY